MGLCFGRKVLGRNAAMTFHLVVIGCVLSIGKQHCRACVQPGNTMRPLPIQPNATRRRQHVAMTTAGAIATNWPRQSRWRGTCCCIGAQAKEAVEARDHATMTHSVASGDAGCPTL